MSDDKIDRDTARLGERMAAIETEVRNLAGRFADHEKADERRHRETIDALGELRGEVSALSGRLDGHEDVSARVPVMQREAFGGMSVREAISTIGVVLALLAALANMIRGEHVDPDVVENIVERIETTPHDEPAAP